MRLRSDERGNVIIWGIGLVIVLFGFAGLAVDTWSVFAQRQEIAGLADSASVVGANQIDLEAFRNGNPDDPIYLEAGAAGNAAAQYVDAHKAAVGPNIGRSVAELTDGSGNVVAVEVTVTRTVTPMILRFAGGEGLEMSVTAVSQPGERGTAP